MKDILIDIINKYLKIFPEEQDRQSKIIDYLNIHSNEEITDWNNFNGHIVAGGFIYAREASDLIDEIKDIARNEVEQCLESEILEWSVIKSRVKKSVDRHLYSKLKRGTSIFPIIVEV